MAKGPAMTRDEAVAAIEAGVGLVEAERGHGLDLIGTAKMGIGNTHRCERLVARSTGAGAESVTGVGTGVDEEGRRRKVAVIERALATNARIHGRDRRARKVGGFEIAGLCGVILPAAASRIPS